jgi:hypothetical protein
MAKKQWEEEARDRFITVLHETTGATYYTDAEDVPVEGGKNFDYRLRSTDDIASPIALELFRLTPHEAELAQNSVWIEIVSQLRKELQAKGIQGYLIHTPHFFVGKARRKTFVRDLSANISQAIAAQPQAQQFEYEGYRITQIPSLRSVQFSNTGAGGAFNPVNLAETCLRDNIGYKNEQLNISGCTRVVLIVNWNPLVDSESVLLACSRFDFSSLENIDNVYFEVAEGKLHLVFDRSVYSAFAAGVAEEEYLEKPLYLQLIQARLADHDRHAFDVVKKITVQRRNIQWLNAEAHSSLGMMAQDFLKAEDLESALWIIRHLRDNTPPDVKALLCWPLQMLVAKNRPDFYPEILDILESYSKHEDESLRAHVPIPLAELAARRRSTNDDGTPFMPAEIGSRVRALAFAMLPGASGYVAERLSWVFEYIRDVSDVEAWDIVSTLAAGVDRERETIATLMIFHAIYRERHFAELGPFDSQRLKQLLHETLRQGRDDLRSTLVWSIWKELKDGMRFDEVLAFLSSVPDGPFERTAFSHLYRIIGEQLKNARIEACELLLKALRRERQYLFEDPRNQVWHFNEFFDAVRLSTKICSPEVAGEIIRTLYEIADRLGISTGYLEQVGI